MKKVLLTAAMALGLGTAAAQAGPVNIGGVVWDPASPFDALIASDSGSENVLGVFGNEIRGFGRISNINETNTFCPGCELTFEFGGFMLTDQSVNGDGYNLVFNGGWLNFYVDYSNDYSAANVNSAINGDLWLSLAAATDTRPADGGSSSFNGTLFGNLTTGTLFSNPQGSGLGYFDVSTLVNSMRADAGALIGTTGAANGNFDTDTRTKTDGDTADFSFTSSFQPYANPIPGSDFQLKSTNEMVGDSIPEPGILGLFGMALAGVGLLVRRRKA